MKKSLLFVLLITVQTVFAQIISKDLNFASNGIYTMPGNLTFSMAQNSDGGIYFTHNENTHPGINVTASSLSKLTTNGILDSSFGSNGTMQLPYNCYLNKIEIQTDGKLVVFGFTSSESVAISRILPNGQLDSTFGTNGTVVIPSLVPDQNYGSYGITLQNEKLLVHAVNYGQNVQHQHVILRLNANGSLDNTFGNNGYLATQGTPAGRTFVQTDSQSNIICFNSNNGFIRKFNSNGQAITNFGNNGVAPLLNVDGYGYGSTNTVLVDSNNKILFSLDTEDKILRLNPYGSIDNTFNYIANTNSGLNGGSWIQSITEKNGSYYVGGTGNPNNLISKLTQNGLVDSAFNDYLQTDSDVEKMIINDNNIIIQGNGHIVKYMLNNSTLSTINNTKSDTDISFENPVKQNLIFKSEETINKIEVYSVEGKLVKTIQENFSDVSELPKGIYFAKVTLKNGKILIKKLVKN